MADWEELTDPYTEIEGDHDFPDTSGTACVSIGGADETGMILSAGAGMLPPAWGAEDDPDRERVDNWTEVADLGSVVPGVLNAAIWGGRLWLKITESAITPTESGGDWSELTETPMTQPLGAVDENGFPTSNSRPVFPGWSVCPKEDAESLLKTAGGQWRGDVEWCPLCSFQFYKDDPAVGASPWWVTVWLVVVGDTLVFYTTESERSGTGSDWRRFNSYEQTGREETTPAGWRVLDLYEGEASTALTPWQQEDAEPATDAGEDWGEALGTLGNLNVLSADFDGVPPVSPPLRLCSMAHCVATDGVQWWSNNYLRGWSVAPQPPFNVQGGRSNMEWVQEMLEVGYIHVNWKPAANDSTLNETHIYRQPWAYQYDPQAANGRGYYPEGRALGWGYLGDIWVENGAPVLENNRLSDDLCTEAWVAGGLNWGEWAEPLRTVCTWEADTAHGHLCLIIGGTEINDTLCTDSCFGLRWYEP